MKIIKKALAYLVLLLIWQLVYIINVDIIEIWKEYSFPSPVKVLLSLKKMCLNGTLFIAVFLSVKRILIGYIASLLIGGTLGIVLARVNFIRENYRAVFLGIQTLPSICWIPFAILWFGISEETILFVILIGAAVSIALGTEAGISGVNPIYIKAGKNMGATGIKLYQCVILPAAFPQILMGMKQGWSLAFRGLMAGEMLAASMGMGQILMAGREMADINQVTAVILIIITLGLIVDKFIFQKLESKIKNQWSE